MHQLTIANYQGVNFERQYHGWTNTAVPSSPNGFAIEIVCLGGLFACLLLPDFYPRFGSATYNEPVWFSSFASIPA
jgi:hypothetical protein